MRVASRAAAALPEAVDVHRMSGTILSLLTLGPAALSVRVKFRAARDLRVMLPESAVVMSGAVKELVFQQLIDSFLVLYVKLEEFKKCNR